MRGTCFAGKIDEFRAKEPDIGTNNIHTPKIL
jgi:hypothetical protein